MAREHLAKTDSYLVTWTVEPGEAGKRLDVFLKEKYRRLSREFLQRSIKNKQVTLNHKDTKPSQVLRVADKVYVLSIRKDEPEVDLDFKVLYEDEAILVVDKPGNLPVHPTGRYFFHTLLTQLQIVNTNEVDQTKNFHIVHRLDRETSGVLVLGKTAKAAASLVDQFQMRKTEKEYLAIVKGRVEKEEFLIDAPLAKDPHSEIRIKMDVVEMNSGGEPLYVPVGDVLPAQTLIQVREHFKNYTLVACKPHTGRQHQIRVHLNHVGHPIVGDKLYGVEAEVFLRSMKSSIDIEVEPGIRLARHALHAHRLVFTHPVNGKSLEFRSALPPELEAFLEKIR